MPPNISRSYIASQLLRIPPFLTSSYPWTTDGECQPLETAHVTPLFVSILWPSYEDNWISQKFTSLTKQCRYSIRSKYGLIQVFRVFPLRMRRNLGVEEANAVKSRWKVGSWNQENIPASEPQSVTVFSIDLVPLECQGQFDNSAQTQCPDSSTSPNSPSQVRLQLRTTSRIISPRE